MLCTRLKRPLPAGNLQMIVALSVIGILTALNLMLRFPDLGAVIAQYNQF